MSLLQWLAVLLIALLVIALAAIGAGQAGLLQGTPPADLGVLAELVGNDPQVMREVLEAFRKNAALSAQELARAQADGSLQSMAGIAHKLKSAARSIGAARLGQICAEIEEAATHSPRGAALPPLMA